MFSPYKTSRHHCKNIHIALYYKYDFSGTTSTDPDGSADNTAHLSGIMTITNWDYNDDLRDPSSALYKRLSNIFCEEVSEIFMLPIFEIDLYNTHDSVVRVRAINWFENWFLLPFRRVAQTCHRMPLLLNTDIH